MKTKVLLKCLFLLLSVTGLQKSVIVYGNASQQPEKVKFYYAYEIDSIVCGYIEVTESLVRNMAQELIQQDNRTFVMFSLLGSKFNTIIDTRIFFDQAARKCVDLVMDVDQGGKKYTFHLKKVKERTVVESPLSATPNEFVLDPDVITSNYELNLRIFKDFIEKKVNETRYKIFDISVQEAQESLFRKVGEELLELPGQKYNTVIIEQVNSKTGVRMKYWFSPDFKLFVKLEVQNKKMYLSDRSIIDHLAVASLDKSYFLKVKEPIKDIGSVSYMKLRLTFAPTGIKFGIGDLTTNRQVFTGTIDNNVVDGILEIKRYEYNGTNAPPFPADYSKDVSLAKYLTADMIVESDDPVLAARAKEIAAGSKDSWDAIKRLGEWVAENISYSLPGGTARKTFDTRSGECGAHSKLLASFCRAEGIPCRIVFGATYTNAYGGGFGQHAWNEVYMGNAGWIAVDATAYETDFVDAGHIHIAEVEPATAPVFNGKNIEVLDYKLTESDNKESSPSR